MINRSLILSGAGILALLLGILVVLLIWNKPVLVIYIQLAYCCFMRFLITQLRFPEFIKYMSDFLTIILLIQIILKFHKTKTLNIRKPLFFIVLFTAVSVFSTLFNRASFIFFFWGARSYFRFFVFFLACTIFLKTENIDRLLKFLLALLPVNTVLALYQFFVMGLADDFVGGLFGTSAGCNAEMYMYLISVCLVTIVYYVKNKMSIYSLISNIAMAGIISSVSELKIVFLVLPFILIAVFIFTFPNKRAITMFVMTMSLLIVTFAIFLVLYPEWVGDLSSFSGFMEHTVEDKYAGEYSLGRFTAGPFIFQNILTTIPQKLFGVGFGNADSFLFFESDAFMRYAFLAYELFTYSLLLFEIGIVGLVFYCLFFLSLLFESLRIKRKIKPAYSSYCMITLIISMLIFQFIVYNQSMYMDCAFICFFLLAFPFILEKESYEHDLISVKLSLDNNTE